MLKHATIAAVLALAGAFPGCLSSEPSGRGSSGSGGGQAAASERRPSALALASAMEALGLSKNAPGLLMLTNAGFGNQDGRTTEEFTDVVTEVTGCSAGRRTLLCVHTPAAAPLWFAAFGRESRKMVFSSWSGGRFESELLDAKPGILEDEGAMKAASAGLAGRRFFQVMSISEAWAEGADWELLKCAEFHNHCCGGVTSGYLAGKYIMANLPLRGAEKYVFVTSSPSCPMDALQFMFDATVGKQAFFSTRNDPENLKNFTVEGARPLVIVLRVDKEADTCDGTLLGFAWGAGPRSKSLAARAKEDLGCVKVLKQFAGDAAFAVSLTETGADAYAIAWEK